MDASTPQAGNLIEVFNLDHKMPASLRDRILTKGRITDRIDADTHIPLAQLGLTPPAPKSVKIELTGRCNLGCTFCALTTREKQPARSSDMPFELYRRIVDDMVNCGVEKFGMFLIGESFLNIDLLEEAIAYVTSLKKFTFLTTNGTLTTPENAKRVFRAGLKSLKWSLTTADDEQYELVTQRKAKLRHQAVANMKAVWEIRNNGDYNCELSASWIKFEDEQQAAMAEAIAEARPFLDTIYGLPLYSFGSLAEAGERASGLTLITPGNTGRVGNPVSPLPCWLPFNKTHVLHTGELTLCAFDAGLPNHNWVCGDLKTQSFMEAWHSEFAQTLRAAHLKGDVTGTICEKCAAYGSPKEEGQGSIIPLKQVG